MAPKEHYHILGVSIVEMAEEVGDEMHFIVLKPYSAMMKRKLESLESQLTNAVGECTMCSELLQENKVFQCQVGHFVCEECAQLIKVQGTLDHNRVI